MLLFMVGTSKISLMDFLDVFIVSISMSVDAMVVGSTDGLREPEIPWWKIALIALTFGFFQFAMPVIGYFVGYSFQAALEKAIPWIAFALLGLLAVKSLVEFIKERRESKQEKEEEEAPHKVSAANVLMQGVATSIDALCIGFVFLNYTIPNAILSFGIIGICTFVLSFMMIVLGKFLGSKIAFFRDYAGLFSAIVFFGVGLKILLEGIL